jgi:hypothetical protein
VVARAARVASSATAVTLPSKEALSFAPDSVGCELF